MLTDLTEKRRSKGKYKRSRKGREAQKPSCERMERKGGNSGPGQQVRYSSWRHEGNESGLSKRSPNYFGKEGNTVLESSSRELVTEQNRGAFVYRMHVQLWSKPPRLFKSPSRHGPHLCWGWRGAAGRAEGEQCSCYCARSSVSFTTLEVMKRYYHKLQSLS
jgi:hypothetical protein